jgi:hypothetical protein
MSSHAYAYPDDPTERAAVFRAVGLDHLGRTKKPDVIPIEQRRRKPLGLAPVPDDHNDEPESYDEPDLDRGPVIDITAQSQAFLDAAAENRFVYFCLNTAASLTETLGGRTKAKFAKQASEISELRAALVEARHEIRELKLIQESMRVANRGERGVDGARGVPGRDGRDGVGQIGPKARPARKVHPPRRSSAGGSMSIATL